MIGLMWKKDFQYRFIRPCVKSHERLSRPRRSPKWKQISMEVLILHLAHRQLLPKWLSDCTMLAFCCRAYCLWHCCWCLWIVPFHTDVYVYWA